MSKRLRIVSIALLAGFMASPAPLFAENLPSGAYKVLASKEGGFNVLAIEELVKKGDKSIAKGDLDQARNHYDKARQASRQLLSFYRDLAGAFRGLDARIPREMDAKGRQTLELLAKTNLRLAALFRRQNRPEVAVPVLVEVVRLMTPAKPEGKEAYQTLVELGFVNTPYLGGR